MDYIIKIFSRVFSLYYEFSGNYGFSLFLLSISSSLLIFSLNSLFKKYQIKELEIQKIINPQIKLIKNESKKNERHLRIKKLYERYSYNPIFEFRLLIPFIIQLPFLFSVYFMLLNFENLKGISFGIIKDLSDQDGLFYGINVLPFLMTIVFVLLSIYSKVISPKEKKQSYFISLLFLFLLYNSPSSLIIFWTINSLILHILSSKYLDAIKKLLQKNFTLVKRHIITNLINRFSITLIILPYLILKCNDQYFLYYLLIPSLLMTSIIDYFTLNFNKIIKLGGLVFISYFFYSLIFYIDTHNLYHFLRFRYFSLIIILLLYSIFYFTSKFKKERFLNLFLIVFAILGGITKIKSSYSDINELRNSLELKISKVKFNHADKKSDKPIVLIVVDELALSNEVFNLTNLDIDCSFDEFLIKKNYYVKNYFKTHSKKTKISTSSMLNFNLKNSDWIKEYESRDEFASSSENFNSLLRNNLLVESLYDKGINSHSFGKVDFRLGKANENFFFPWENIGFSEFNTLFENSKMLKTFFSKSILSFIDARISPTNINDYNRKQIFDNLSSIKFEKESFYFFHLDAPHPPFSYFKEFPELDVDYNLKKNSNEDYINSYVSYRRFILDKLSSILDDKKFEKTRVIIVGDHGLRNTKEFDPYLTFGAFYGFDEKDLIKINEVQDVGSLINSYLN